MNPFDALLCEVGDLERALLDDSRRVAGGDELLARIRLDPDHEGALALLSRTGGRPHPYDLAVAQLARTTLRSHEVPPGKIGMDAVRALGRELLDLPAADPVTAYLEGLPEPDSTT